MIKKSIPKISLYIGLLIINFCIGISSAMVQDVIKPVVFTPQRCGDEFEVGIEVENVTNLFGVAFVLNYDTTYIDALSADAGDFLGSDVIFFPVIDDGQGTVSIGVTRKTPAGGVNGSGVVAKVKFMSANDTPDETKVQFTIADITAVGPTGAPIVLTPYPTEVTLWCCVCPKVGDVSGNGTVSAYDASLILQFVVGLIDKFPCESQQSPITSTPQSYSITVPHLAVATGNKIQAPIIINDASGVASGGIVLRYDPKVLRATNVVSSSLLSGYYWQFNTELNGEVRIAFAGGNRTISGDGVLFYVEFEALSKNIGKVSPLILEIAQISENLNITKFNGSIAILPEKSTLLQNYPNPFNPETWVPYLLVEPANATLKIYSATGELVRTLDLGYKDAGIYLNKGNAAYWDGKDKHGKSVASGVYFYSLQAGKFTATRKMVIVK